SKWIGSDLSMSIINLHPDPIANTLTVASFFTPYNYASLGIDMDLGVDGPLLIPNTNLLFTGSKAGIAYLVDRTTMGGFNPSSNNNVQTFQAATTGHIHGSPTFWNSPQGGMAYIWAESDTLKAFHMNKNGLFDTTPSSQSSFTAPPGMPGGILSVSANGSTAGSGILWANIPLSGNAL